MILLLAGTGDGRELAVELAKQGFKVLASVTTSHGGALLQDISGITVNIDRLDEAGLRGLIEQYKVKGILDATHPFAQKITQLAQAVARSANCPYLRWERQVAVLPESPLLHRVQGWEELAKRLSSMGVKKVFLAVGVKNLPFIVTHPLLAHCSFTARVLPLPSAVATCLDAGLKPQQILALQGHGSRGLNKAVFEHFQPEVVVTKESGSKGGTAEKVEAALELEIPVVLVERPLSESPSYGLHTSCQDVVMGWAKQIQEL